jgi:hypothetical protein
MSFLRTHADLDPALSTALGRFAQAAATLEHSIYTTITRMLPLTTRMGQIILAANSGMNNAQILLHLAELPEVPLPGDRREQLRALGPTLRTVIEDRNRVLHNRIIEAETGYCIIQERQNPADTVAIPFTLEFLNSRIDLMQKIAHDLVTYPVLEYDLSQWGRAFAQYPLREYPKARQPKSSKPRPSDRRDAQARKAKSD